MMTRDKFPVFSSETAGSESSADPMRAACQLGAADQRALVDWYLAFRRAAAREHAIIAPAVAAMNMDQMAVPVMIPLQAAKLEMKKAESRETQQTDRVDEQPGSRKKTSSLVERLGCLDLYQALLLAEFTRLTAANPDQPTTHEIALAQIQLAIASFTTGSFAEMIDEVQP